MNKAKEQNKSVSPGKPGKPGQKPSGPNIFGLLKPYKSTIFFLLLFALIGNALNLLLPKVISASIDAYTHHKFDINSTLFQFFLVAYGVFFFTYLQTVIQTYASERVASDLREKLSAKISRQSHSYIQKTDPSKLLTNLTSDIDSIKMFVSQAVVSIVSSLFIIVGAGALLLSINWVLGLAVLAILPIIGGTFFIVLRQVRALFKTSREIIDRLNKTINESILGAAIIRVLNSQSYESKKFLATNSDARDLGMRILNLFAGMIPIITFVSNFATLVIVVLGGHFVINKSMSLGDLAAFNSYLVILIFPIFILGFMSNIIAQATASYQRISEVLDAPENLVNGEIKSAPRGHITLDKINLSYGEKPVLKDVSIEIKPGTRTAIIGPTAAGKTQLLYLLTGLIPANSGQINFDGKALTDYDKETFHQNIGFVFQDSIMFNMSVRENIAFNKSVTDQSLQKAIDTAELQDFISTLPEGLNTIVSERGSSLSGGQKQRIMLARALALNPKILLLDDFTARVDNQTERKIINNLFQNYPGVTLISVTQKISSVENYDQIILLMEGEVLASGTHQQLMETSPEYVQIYNSQHSTNHYE